MWQDIGGIWCIIEYGFNMDSQIVYQRKFCEIESYNIPERVELHNYYPKNHFKTESESKEWLSRYPYSNAPQ